MSRPAKIILGFAILDMALLLAIPRTVCAQGEWKPIPPEDLALKDNPKSPGANAMILYRESVTDSGHIFTDGVAVYEYVRIKIFTKEGAAEGNVEIPFVRKAFDYWSWRSAGGSDIREIRGRTIRPDGSIAKFDGKVNEKTIVKAGSEKYLAKTFTLPDVQPGCIIEYKYRKQYEPLWLIGQEWILSGRLFTREAHFLMEPYTGQMAGELYLVFSFSNLQTDAPVEKKSTPFAGQDNLSYSLVVQDIPEIDEEPLMPPERSLQQRVSFSYHEAKEPVAESPGQFWSFIGRKWNGSLERFINKKDFLTSELSRVADPTESPEVKLRKIYARAQSVRNLDMEDSKTEQEKKREGIRKNSNVEDVLKRGFAGGDEINFLFVGLARAAGFDAAEVYVVPRNEDVFDARSIDTDQLSANVVWVKAGTQEYYLDPGSRYFPFGILPWFESAAGGVRVSNQGGTFVTTPAPKSSDATIIRHADLEVGADGSVTGKVQVDFAGQRGALLREQNRKEDEAGRKKALEGEIHDWLPGGSTFEITKIENWDDVEAPVHAEGKVEIPAFGTSGARRVLVPATIFRSSQADTFQSERRVNDIQFPFPYQETDDIKFKAPAGFGVESVPQTIWTGPAVTTYELTATQQGNTVEVKRHLDEQGTMFNRGRYSSLRDFFNSVKTNDDAQIIFFKVDSPKGN